MPESRFTSTYLHQLLRHYWGYTSFRPQQEEIISEVLIGKDALALLPTGGGKSLCYQAPALAMDGMCLVISPLVALMENQVAHLQKLGIPAVALHAGVQGATLRHTIDETLAGNFKFLYCSPERLQSRMFQQLLPHLPLNLIAVDEAHCVSQWGHDFRPEYREISFLKKRFPRLPLIAVTASATPEVLDDVRNNLLIPQAKIFRQSFARENIYYDIHYSESKPVALVSAIREAKGSSIIYCRSRRQTEALSAQLKQDGIRAVHYHAGMNATSRKEAQESWMSGETPVMAATTAFGMGIDKADVRLVLHYELPEDLESWYQESGRAGRDGAPAVALSLYSTSDLKRLLGSTKQLFPPEKYLREVYQAVVEYLQIPIGNEPDQYYSFEIADFCKKFSFKATAAAPALRLLAQEGLWTLTDSVFRPPTLRFLTQREELDMVGERYPLLGTVCTALLRMYTGIFRYPVAIDEFSISNKLRWKKEDLHKALAQLAAMGLVEWEPVEEGPKLFFHSYRVESENLIINTKRIEMLRSRHETRIQAMLRFVEERSSCRSISLLTYFGEQTNKPCGHCDLCRAAQTAIPTALSIREQVHQILEAAQRAVSMADLTSRFPGEARSALQAALRDMVDNNELDWHPDNSFTLALRPRKKSKNASRS
jgi:ATP-dependent DNA helicase RecQ